MKKFLLAFIAASLTGCAVYQPVTCDHLDHTQRQHCENANSRARAGADAHNQAMVSNIGVAVITGVILNAILPGPYYRHRH